MVKLHIRMLNYSLWLALLTILIFPGSPAGIKGIKYGYPVSFFTYYHEDPWFIKGVSINIVNYCVNTLIIYFLVLGVNALYRRWFNRDSRQG